MRVPSIGLKLDERRIVREGRQIAERMLDGYAVTANGRFVSSADARNGLMAWLAGAVALAGLADHRK